MYMLVEKQSCMLIHLHATCIKAYPDNKKCIQLHALSVVYTIFTQQYTTLQYITLHVHCPTLHVHAITVHTWLTRHNSTYMIYTT